MKHGTFKTNYNEVDYLSGGPGNGWWDATTYTENRGSPSIVTISASLSSHAVQFKLNSAAIPSGAQDPEGRVLALVLDAHTGQVEDLHLGDTEPEIDKLGQVSGLK